MAGTLVVAGLWVRPLAEAARLAGWRVVAMDLFGDADTRRASTQWWRIGDPAAFTITPSLLRDALHRAAHEPGILGWVAGSGFEGTPQALALRIPGLPLLGMSAAAVRRLRDPGWFFATLDKLGLEHPAVSLHPPRAGAGWLVKDAGGAGGWHIRAATDAKPRSRAGIYWQRCHAGEPMSALFVADGTQARVVALNRLIVRPLGPLPFVYHGAIGPIHDPALVRRMEYALSLLVPAFGLRGLASLDFIAQGHHAWLLEVNPRPSASMVLHEHAWPGGLMRAHVRAVRGQLPGEPAEHPPGLRGSMTVFAQEACGVGPALAAQLSLAGHCHDIPAPGARFGAAEPVCSVSAWAATADAVLAELDARAAQVRSRLTRDEEVAA